MDKIGYFQQINQHAEKCAKQVNIDSKASQFL